MDFVIPKRNYIEINDPTISFGGIGTQEAPIDYEGDKPTPEALTQQAFSNLRKDLGLSFMVSQGLDSDQESWLRAVAHSYKSTWSQDKLNQLAAAIETMDDVITAAELKSMTSDDAPGKRPPEMRSPKKHEPTVQAAATRDKDPVSREAQFSKHWTTFRTWLTDEEPVERNNGKLTLPLKEVAIMTDRMLQRDLQYQAANKPRGGGHIFANGDPHSSLFQVHALQGVSTGSEAYDSIFGAMRNLYETVVVDGKYEASPLLNDMVDDATRLKDGWQLNHPGEEFDSNPERSDALRVRTAATLGALASSSV